MTKKKKGRLSAGGTARRPIADKVVKRVRSRAGAEVVDLAAVRQAKLDVEAMQDTVATPEELAEYHPAHAVYLYAENQASVMAEQLIMLPETDRFARLIERAEDTYLPNGPPVSPLTTSFFACWAFFDASVGLAQETLGTIMVAVGRACGVPQELLRVIGLMQDSRMGVYVNEGVDDGAVVLRELVTNDVRRAICPAGYDGQPGELWYARVLPPPIDGAEEHVVFTTPYVLIDPDEREWMRYFDRALPDGPLEERVAALAHHMKWGPTRDYWPEFVFEGYAYHRHDAIFLEGLPDVPESRPHFRPRR